ncbi:34588_t:CDS:1, partial [Gigaspora margarita]
MSQRTNKKNINLAFPQKSREMVALMDRFAIVHGRHVLSEAY